MNFRNRSVEQKTFFNQPRNCLRDLIILYGDYVFTFTRKEN